MIPKAVEGFWDNVSRTMRFGHFPEDASAIEITYELLSNPDSPVKRLIEAAKMARDCTSLQDRCRCQDYLKGALAALETEE